jgi:hypothetical protein
VSREVPRQVEALVADRGLHVCVMR